MAPVNILVLGSRRGLKKALKRMEIPFTICKDYKNSPPEDLNGFTHVLASGEGTVALANQVRKELNLPSYPDEVITLCSDKYEMKKKAKANQISVTPFLEGDCDLSSEEIYATLGPKVVVKDKNNSGGKGQEVFISPRPIQSSKDQLIEGFVVGKEMSVESFIQKGEIKFVSTTTYIEIGVINLVPAQIETDVLEQVLAVNKNIIEAFGILNGLTHLEVYLTDKGVLFGEVALRPPGGHIMTLINEAHGIEAWEYYVDIHLGKELPNSKSIGKNAGAIIYHPGMGKIEAIQGLEAIDKLKTLSLYKVKGEVGDEVSSRRGVGQEQAHFIFSGTDKDLLLEEIGSTRTTFKMVMN